MKKIAFIYPGQGSQSIGMGKDLYENFESAKKVFDKANEILNKDIRKICFEGPEELLKETVNTQPAILTTSIACLEALKSELNIIPDYVAGHSLGEYAALYTANAVNLENVLKLIQKRADLMSEATGGAMAAVLNADEQVLQECLNQANKVGYVSIANYNSPAQVVITGDEKAVEKAGELLMEKGVKRFIPLAVSGAFHSEFMKDAGEKFAEFLKEIDVCIAKIPVVTNVDAEFTVDNFKDKMSKQIYSSVLWTQTIEKMVNEGVEIFVEIGNGKVLTGLNKKINQNVQTFNVYDKITLKETVKKLKEVL